MFPCREDLQSSQNRLIPSLLMEGKRRYFLTTRGPLDVGYTADTQPMTDVLQP